MHSGGFSKDSGEQNHDSKRHKQTDKAKLHLLTQQLQTRLQYARLKVDHGWMRQNLNEVENLYFHHYRTRAPADPVEEEAAYTPPGSEGTVPTSSRSKSTLLPPARLIPPSRATSKSPSVKGTTSTTADSIGRRPGRTTPYSPYSPSPSTALALTASPNYANIHTRPVPISAGGSPTPYTHPPTTAATYINAGNSRPPVPATSTLTTNPYSMTNLSRLGPAPIPIRGNSTSAPSVMWPSQHPKGASSGGVQTYDSFWSLLSGGGGGSLPTSGPIVVPIVTSGGGDAITNQSSRGKTPALLTKRAGVHKKTKNSKVGAEAD